MTGTAYNSPEENFCCPKLNCIDSGTFCILSGALSLFNMNFSLKQLVEFAVVMVANGIL